MSEKKSPRVQARSLFKQGAWSEADRVLSAAAAAPESSVQDTVEWVKSAALRGDFPETAQRLKHARSRWKTVNWAPLEGKTLLMSRDYGRASSLIVAALLTVRDPQEAAVLKDLKLESDLMKSVVARLSAAEQHAAPGDLGVYAINLDENVDRWDRISSLVRPRSLRRIAGVPGRCLADGIMVRFGPQVSPQFKGTLGCFLAHFAAWETHLKSVEPYALILEDDCLPLIDIPESSAALMLPEDFDICFLTSGVGKVDKEEQEQGVLPVYRPVEMTISRLAPVLIAPGAYGYVLSRRGAERLIARVNEDGFFGDVDWRMISYCLPRRSFDDYPKESFSRGALAAHFRVLAPREPMVGFTCHPGLIKPGHLDSIRTQNNKGRHAHLELQEESGT
jgi:hypothetical protein